MTMSRNMDQLMAGAEVYGADNEKIGAVADVGQNYFLVQKGFLFIKDLYLPTRLITRSEGDRVYLSISKHEAESMASEQLPPQGDAWYGADTTTTTRSGRAEETVNTSGRAGREGENIAVPVIEEQLQAGTRDVAAGHARVVKDVRQEQQSIDVPVQHEEVYVTERAVNRPATQAELNMRDRDIEIPLREQQVVTQKQAVVTGEVTLRKQVTQETEHVTDTVRREEVHVEDVNNPHVHVEGNLNDMQRRRFETMSEHDRQRYGQMSAEERMRYDNENPMR